MNYWLINGMGVQAVDISTALHKYGQWLRNNKGKPTVGDSGKIDWKRITEGQYKCCSHKQ
jgi:hypothetical protein